MHGFFFSFPIEISGLDSFRILRCKMVPGAKPPNKTLGHPTEAHPFQTSRAIFAPSRFNSYFHPHFQAHGRAHFCSRCDICESLRARRRGHRRLQNHGPEISSSVSGAFVADDYRVSSTPSSADIDIPRWPHCPPALAFPLALPLLASFNPAVSSSSKLASP